MNKNCTFQAQLESAVLDISVLRSSVRNILLFFFFFCILNDKCVWNQFETIATQPDWSSNQELFFVYLTPFKNKPKTNRDITDGAYRIVACVIRNQMIKRGIKGMTSWHFNLHCSMVNCLFIIYMHLNTLDYFLHIWTWLFECFSHQDLARTAWLCKPFLTCVSLLAGLQPLYLKSSIG